MILNPLQMDATTDAEALFYRNPRRKNKASILDITTIDPCVSFNL